VSSPLLAVFSGLMYKGNYGIRRIPEVVAQSGSALVHFYSDVAYNMTGFNITYRYGFFNKHNEKVLFFLVG